MATPFDRFTYFYFRVINPLLNYDDLPYPVPTDMEGQGAHASMSAHYQCEYEAGDEKAIFEYAKSDGWAFRADWFRDQVEAWRIQGTAESIKKLRDLMKSYTAAQGKTTYENLLYIVGRDQAIFTAVMYLHRAGFPLESLKTNNGCYERVAKQFRIGTYTVEEVYKNYQRAIDSYGPEQQGTTVDNAWLKTVFIWLYTMAQQLRNWGG